MARKSAAALATRTPPATNKRPPPPDGLPPDAAALWVSICSTVEPSYFSGADLTLLKALVLADSQKRVCDALVARQGPILADGKPNPAAKLSNQYAATLAALSGKLRLCASSRTRPDAAGLKQALSRGPRPWESAPEVQEFFQ